MERILIIGANGQIGSELVSALADKHGAQNVTSEPGEITGVSDPGDAERGSPSAVPLSGGAMSARLSADALATLHRRAEEAGVAERVTPLQGEVERLPAAVTSGSYDLVLCHGLLEVVDSPAETLAAVAGALRPGGCASVLAAGRAAALPRWIRPSGAKLTR